MSEIKFIELKCQRCGGELEEQSENAYICTHCGKKWAQTALHGLKDMLEACEAALRGQRVADIANLRRLLWAETHKKYVSNIEVARLCGEIKKYLPNDFYADFYLATCDVGKTALGDFLNTVNAREHYDDIPDMLEYIFAALKPEWTMGVSNFIEKLKDIDTATYHKYRTRFEEEYNKIEECIFEPTLPRDVFIAYSSKDMPEVTRLVTYLEEENLTCFVAARNMRHGSGSVENYENIIRTAIDHCSVILFVSSDNSRSVRCDAYRELDYINKSCSHKPRVEYLVKNYSGRATERFFTDFFKGLEYCLSVNDAVQRVLGTIMAPVDRIDETAAAESDAPSNPDDGQIQTPQTEEAKAEPEAREQNNEIAAQTEEKPAQNNQVQEQQPPISEDDFNEQKVCANPDCGYWSDKAARFCPKCGGTIFYETYGDFKNSNFKFCASCFHANDVQNLYCVNCGSSDFISYYKLKQNQAEAAANAEAKSRAEEERQRKFKNDFIYSNGNKKFIDGYKGNDAEVEIPDFATSIYGLGSCNSVKSLYIPDSVDYVSYNAFSQCHNLECFKVSGGNKKYMSIDGNLYSGDGKTLVRYAAGKNKECFTVPNEVTSIEDYAFNECKSLKKIILPHGLKSIGDRAFQNCSSLTTLIIPSGVNSVGYYAFNGCYSLTLTCKLNKPKFGKPRGWERDWHRGFYGTITWDP